MTLVIGPSTVLYVILAVWIVALLVVGYAHLGSYRYQRQFDGCREGS